MCGDRSNVIENGEWCMGCRMARIFPMDHGVNFVSLNYMGFPITWGIFRFLVAVLLRTVTFYSKSPIRYAIVPS